MLTYADVCYSVKLHPEDVDSVCMLAALLSLVESRYCACVRVCVCACVRVCVCACVRVCVCACVRV